jgi:hypothetical protein
VVEACRASMVAEQKKGRRKLEGQRTSVAAKGNNPNNFEF